MFMAVRAEGRWVPIQAVAPRVLKKRGSEARTWHFENWDFRIKNKPAAELPGFRGAVTFVPLSLGSHGPLVNHTPVSNTRLEPPSSRPQDPEPWLWDTAPCMLMIR